MKEKIRSNKAKIKQSKVLPYLVGNVVEIVDTGPEEDKDLTHQDLSLSCSRKCAVIKTPTRKTVFLPLVGLIRAEDLKPGDLIGVNRNSYIILDTLPPEFDSRVKAMEVIERPTDTYENTGRARKADPRT